GKSLDFTVYIPPDWDIRLFISPARGDMRRSFRALLVGILGLTVSTIWVTAGSPGGQVARPSASPPSGDGRQLVTRYCVTCHNERMKTGNLVLEHVDSVNPEVGEKVVRKLRTGQMPPPGAPRPEKQ